MTQGAAQRIGKGAALLMASLALAGCGVGSFAVRTTASAAGTVVGTAADVTSTAVGVVTFLPEADMTAERAATNAPAAAPPLTATPAAGEAGTAN